MVTDPAGDTREVFNVPGRRFIVADCGGGTVDFTSYQVESTRSMIEIGGVSGEARGATYVNKAVEKDVLVPRLGGEALYAKLLARAIPAWARFTVGGHVGPAG